MMSRCIIPNVLLSMFYTGYHLAVLNVGFSVDMCDVVASGRSTIVFNNHN